MFSLEGKIALVTGSSQGMGFAITDMLAKQGANVFMCDYRLDIAERGRARMAGLHPERRFWALGFDMSDWNGIAAGIEQVKALTGKLDILVNNAGINIRKPLAEMEDSVWDKVMDINLNGVFRLCRAAFPLLSANGGKVLNQCSFMAEFARADVTPYAASKAGLRQLTRALAVEWAPYNIQVNAMAPGYVDTEINAPNKANKEFYDRTIMRTPAGRWGQPSEVASVAAFLVSPAANFVTGQMLCVDGGLSVSL